MLFPTREPLVCREVDGYFLVHDDRSGSAHRLNPVAQVIWQLCDGQHDTDTIKAEVAARFGKLVTEVESDVDDTLVRFRDLGLILSSDRPGDEADLLVLCVRAAIGTLAPGPIGDVRRVNWNALVHTALHHGVLPLVYQSLRTHWRNEVPPLVLDRLRRQYQANARVNRRLQRELLEVLSLFAAHGIEALPLRGPVMARSLYGTISLRQFGDLDIFMRPQDVARARTLLTTRGYEFPAGRSTDTQAEREVDGCSVTIDLQWALARPVYRFPLTLDEAWSNLQSVRLAGAKVWQPADEDHALILCAHATKHCWRSLVWMADFAMFVRKHQDGLDWSRLVERAASRGGERQLLLGLRLAQDVLGIDVPDHIVARIRGDSTVETLSAELRRRLFVAVENPTHQGSYGFIEGGLLYMRTKERLRDRVPYAGQLLLHPFRCLREWITPNVYDRAVVALPESLGFLYYLIRPVRLAMYVGGRLIAHTRGSSALPRAGRPRPTGPT